MCSTYRAVVNKVGRLKKLTFEVLSIFKSQCNFVYKYQTIVIALFCKLQIHRRY